MDLTTRWPHEPGGRKPRFHGNTSSRLKSVCRELEVPNRCGSVSEH